MNILQSHYTISPSKKLALLLILFYSSAICCTFTAPLTLAITLSCCAILDAIRHLRRHAWLTAKSAIVQLHFISMQRQCIVTVRSGDETLLHIKQVLQFLPGIIKLDVINTLTSQSFSLFIANDMLPPDQYHQFTLQAQAAMTV